MELKQGVSVKVPVRLRAVVDGSALSGVTSTQVVVYVQKHGGAATLKTIEPASWTEIDATNMSGEYDLTLTAGDLDTLGFFKYHVSYPGISMVYPGLIQVVAQIESDTYSRIGAPVSTSISADIQTGITSIKGASNVDNSQLSTAISDSLTIVQDDIVTLSSIAARTLALSYDNVWEDEQTYDSNGKMTSARARFYATAWELDQAKMGVGYVVPLYTYIIEGEYDSGGNCTSFTMKRLEVES
jgi:hypothetical protein